MKYICFAPGGLDDYRMFADSESHKTVAAEVGRSVVSAGFIRSNADGTPMVYGGSISLDVEASERDASMLRIIWGI